ncbi:MAG TPA: 2-isopropylmalate synthase [Ktedonobacterales bacterium]
MSDETYFDREDIDSIGALVAAHASQPGHQTPERGRSQAVRIFDTTLRDGEQSPGASMTLPEKLQVAEQLVRMRVDVIEAGFPIASPGDLAAVREIARRSHGVAIAGLARANREDINACADALRDAERPVLHVFLATSDLHLEHKLGMTREQALATVTEMVRYGRQFFDTIEFSAEDATRSDWRYLSQVYGAAIAAGASVINIPDTVGYTMSSEYTALINHLKKTTPGIEGVTISAHCHNDLGMATANTLAAIAAGAGQVEVTINGLGERAGNTAVEEVVMALNTRADAFDGRVTRVDARQLVPASQLVSRITGIPVQPNKAIVGENAFAHEAGIHQDGMLKHPGTYEIMDPRAVGWAESKLALGKHSGRHGFDAYLRRLGYRLRGGELQNAYSAFIDYVDEHKTATDDELRRIVAESLGFSIARAANM